LQGHFAAFAAAARTQSQALQVRLQRTTPRERLLLLGLALGALIYAPIAVIEWRTAQEERYTQAMTERSAARLAAAAARRVAAETPDSAALTDLQDWGFEASNVAVAQVRIEQQLVAAAAAAGLANVQITTDEEVTATGPVQWLGAEVEADLRWGPAFAFLDELTGWPEGFRVTRFQYDIRVLPGYVQPGQAPATSGKVRIGVAFPVNLPTAPAAPASGGGT
jgi:hypothetical protein